MKKEEIPQDKSSLESKNMKELCYALDKDGKFTTDTSSGWEPKTIALNSTLESIQERIEEAKEEVINGRKSPIVYFMEVHRMDLPTLADYVGIWSFLVKLHFIPFIFKKLSDKTLQKYATVFEISVEELKKIKP